MSTSYSKFKKKPQPLARNPLTEEQKIRKREMSCCALIVQFHNNETPIKFMTNEFSSKFPKNKIGKLKELVSDFMNYDFFSKPLYNGKVKCAAIFDTRTDKVCSGANKLMQWEDYDKLWKYTDYGQSVL